VAIVTTGDYIQRPSSAQLTLGPLPDDPKVTLPVPAQPPTMHLPTDYDARKEIPIVTGLLGYFPLACAAVAHCSKVGNDQHNPGEPLHWDRSKSTDQINTCGRHLTDRVSGVVFDKDKVRHLAKVAWRALAALELEIEADGGRIHGGSK
jgi:hypothetical protein